MKVNFLLSDVQTLVDSPLSSWQELDTNMLTDCTYTETKPLLILYSLTLMNMKMFYCNSFLSILTKDLPFNL